MVEPSLTSRLRQHSRRSGVTVGLSMAITIAILVSTFVWIYVRTGPLLSDFIPREAPAAGTPAVPANVGATPEPSATQPTTEGSQPTAPPAAAETATPLWQPTHRISEEAAVNFRAGPSTTTDVLQVLDPGTQLQFLGEQEEGGSFTWMRFQTQDGMAGWIPSSYATPLNS